MNKNYKRFIAFSLMLMLLVPIVNAERYSKSDINSFENIKKVKVKTLSGNCIVNKGNSNDVEVRFSRDYYPEKNCKTKIRENNGVLRLTEIMRGSGSGHTEWELWVPDGIEIQFTSTSGDFTVTDLRGTFDVSTTSGDFYVEDCQGEFEFSTASGNFEIYNCTGEFKTNTASGDYEIENCSGIFAVSTASGNIRGIELILEDHSGFSSASGNVNIGLGESTKYDLDISSASGDAILDYNGNSMEGYFEMSARVRKGRIISDIDFDDEETYYRHNQKYLRKFVNLGTDDPTIIIATASGKAVLKD